MTTSVPRSRSGGQILVDQLVIQGVQHIFCVPGESYLPALDAMHDAPLKVTVCRQEGGAAMMAESHGKLTGQPGICFVTRGPGATNASPGLHIASQDSTPMILFVGQVDRSMRGRDAFQEVDYAATFGALVKWAAEIDSAERIPEFVSRAFHVAMSGRPGPVVLALPEDVLSEVASCVDTAPVRITESIPQPADLQLVESMLAGARRPVLIVGGSRWDADATSQLVEFATQRDLALCVSFRRQSLVPGSHPNYIGEAGVGANPALVKTLMQSDLIVLLGTRFSEIASQAYTVLDSPRPRQKLIHILSGAEELGRVYQADLALNVTPRAFLKAASASTPLPFEHRKNYIAEARQSYLAWSDTPTEVAGPFNFGKALLGLRECLPSAVTLTTGAGNYAAWVNRFFRFEANGRLVAPTSGSMGYGVPAAVGALRLDPTRLVIAFAGDGCFLMNGQEFATAVQYELPLIVIIVDNGSYGTIRMHQETHFPARVVGTSLRNPDFAAYAVAFGGHGERVEKTEDFVPAFERALAAGKPAIVHCLLDIEAITPSLSLTAIRTAAQQRAMAKRKAT